MCALLVYKKYVTKKIILGAVDKKNSKTGRPD